MDHDIITLRINVSSNFISHVPLTNGSCNVCMRTFNLTRRHDPFSHTLTHHVNLGPSSPPLPACVHSRVSLRTQSADALITNCLSPDRQDAQAAKDGRAYKNVRFYSCYVWYSSPRAQSHHKLEFLITRTLCWETNERPRVGMP